MNRAWVFVLLMTLSACQVLTPPDTEATLQAEGRGYIATATAVRELARIQQTRVMATAEAAATRVMEMQRVNQQLLATVRAGDPLEPLRVDNPAVTEALMDDTSAQFIGTGTASAVRESDGCVDTPQTAFMSDTLRIYATLHAYNVRAGTRMEAAWSFEGGEVLRDSWTVPQDEADICIWFFIDPTLVEFRPGNWSVQLYADGVPAGEAMPFQIAEG